MLLNFPRIENDNKPSSASKDNYCDINEQDILNEKYVIDKYIGEGAYSQVWRAVDKSNKNRLVALKVCKSNKKDNQSGLNEYNMLKTLNHENILKVYNGFYYKSSTGKHFVVVMEYLGDTLAKCKHYFRGDYDNNSLENTNKSVIPDMILKKIVKQLLCAVEYLHNSKKIIHTDIKLDNILLTKRMDKIKSLDDFNIKLVDFGTSHYTHDKLNFTIGTFEYNSPEIILGYPYNTSTDIWSCGCILAELITGYCLFDYSYYYENNEHYSNNSEESGSSSVSTLYSNETDEEDEDIYHIENLLLAMMIKVLGKMPLKLLKRGKYFEVYFTNKGKLRYEPMFLSEDTLYNLFAINYKFDFTNSRKYTNLLSLMLNNNPEKRLTAKKILKHQYYNNL